VAWAGTPWTAVAIGLVSWLYDASMVTCGGLILLALLGIRREGRVKEGALHVGVVALVLLAGVAAQGRFWAYHSAGVRALAGLLAGWGIWQLWDRLRARNRLVFVSLVAALIVWSPLSWGIADPFWPRSYARIWGVLHPGLRQSVRDHLYSMGEYDARENRAAAAWIRDHTDTSDPVFIFGFAPELYVEAHRRPASHFIYDVPLRSSWSRAEARVRLMAELDASHPAVVLIEHEDVMPWVTGSTDDSAMTLMQFPQLREWLASGYCPVVRIGRFDAYRACTRSANGS